MVISCIDYRLGYSTDENQHGPAPGGPPIMIGPSRVPDSVCWQSAWASLCSRFLTRGRDGPDRRGTVDHGRLETTRQSMIGRDAGGKRDLLVRENAIRPWKILNGGACSTLGWYLLGTPMERGRRMGSTGESERVSRPIDAYSYTSAGKVG